MVAAGEQELTEVYVVGLKPATGSALRWLPSEVGGIRQAGRQGNAGHSNRDRA